MCHGWITSVLLTVPTSKQRRSQLSHNLSATVGDISHTFADRRLANRRRRNEAREQILQVARRELKTRPFRELSVDELMQATGLSRTAFYRYFPDREAVLLDLLEEVWGE